jgi:hypothetical protein
MKIKLQKTHDGVSGYNVLKANDNKRTGKIIAVFTDGINPYLPPEINGRIDLIDNIYYLNID